MKMTVIGAGGIRMPLFVRSLLRRLRQGTAIDTLAMTDIRNDRLEIMGRCARHLVAAAGMTLDIQVEPDLDRALQETNAVVTTIRPGFEEGRIVDETICRNAGILGQETVGAGGFAMAARAIPELLTICARAAAIAPNAPILNFTNPSGIVTQALHDAGYRQVIGICDSADNVRDFVAKHRRVKPEHIRTRVFGLNHLSVTTQVLIDERDITAELLADDEFLHQWFGIFGAPLVRELGAFPNEYLYYYLLPEQAVPGVLAEKVSRGQKVKRLTDRFFAEIKRPELADDVAAWLQVHAACLAERDASYMEYAWKGTDLGQRPDHQLEEGEGYAGVALNVLEARLREPRELALIVPNQGTVPWLAASDVIEITCRVDAAGVTPLAPPFVPPRVEHLVRQARIFETLTVLAARHYNAAVARWALQSHPLVADRDIVERIYPQFAASHPAIGAYR